jgi:hypothetical protein
MYTERDMLANDMLIYSIEYIYTSKVFVKNKQNRGKGFISNVVSLCLVSAKCIFALYKPNTIKDTSDEEMPFLNIIYMY